MNKLSVKQKNKLIVMWILNSTIFTWEDKKYFIKKLKELEDQKNAKH